MSKELKQSSAKYAASKEFQTGLKGILLEMSQLGGQIIISRNDYANVTFENRISYINALLGMRLVMSIKENYSPGFERCGFTAEGHALVQKLQNEKPLLKRIADYFHPARNPATPV